MVFRDSSRREILCDICKKKMVMIDRMRIGEKVREVWECRNCGKRKVIID